ncbi:MAG TPA: STT3 domain-containing protein, partial [Candidatus Nanoarchaeia archaeon]|nr:STT3 domain-containing protein [Candidatus Nanoarchaeia archaeon]
MRKLWMWLFIVFTVVFAIRLIAAFQTPFLSSDNSYFHVRLVDAFRHGQLLTTDSLGFGGRTIVASPLFDGIIAFFTLFIPEGIVFKLIPNFFASLLVVPAFLLAHKLTKDDFLSLFAAVLASSVPAFFSHTFNQLTALSLALPVFFMLVYAWLEVPRQILLFLSLL